MRCAGKNKSPANRQLLTPRPLLSYPKIVVHHRIDHPTCYIPQSLPTIQANDFQPLISLHHRLSPPDKRTRHIHLNLRIPNRRRAHILVTPRLDWTPVPVSLLARVLVIALRGDGNTSRLLQFDERPSLHAAGIAAQCLKAVARDSNAVNALLGYEALVSGRGGRGSGSSCWGGG